MLTTGYSSWLWLAFYFLSLPPCFAQSDAITTSGPVASPQPTLQTSVPAQDFQNTLLAFQQEQRALIQQRQALVAGGATQEQLQAWYDQNGAQFAAQQQRAQAMAAASELQLLPVNRQPNIPANASPTLRDFLTSRAALANARRQIHNQLLGSLPSNATENQISQMQQQETRLFQQQNAAALQLQAQRAQTLAAISAQTPLRIPGPPRLPPNVSPQMAAILTGQYQLRVERIQLWNQYANADPATREAAMQQWRQQNAGQIQQLQQQAQNLTQATPTTQN